jgi:Fe-S-cluster containining protein
MPLVHIPEKCAGCGACCYGLVVEAAGGDVPFEMMTTDDKKRAVMKQRPEDKSCVALDRATGLCTIYEDRPTICREFNTDSGQCLEQVANRAKAQQNEVSDHVETVVLAALAYAKSLGFEVDVHKPREERKPKVYLTTTLHRTVLTPEDKERARNAFMEVLR